MRKRFVEIGQAIKQRCYQAGFETAAAVAEALGVSHYTIHEIWRGRPQPEAALRRLALLLGEPEERWVIAGFALKDTPEQRQLAAQMANARAARQRHREAELPHPAEREQYRQAFSACLRALSEERQLPQKEIAAQMGVNSAQVYKWMAGLRIPSAQSLAGLAAVLSVPVETLRAPLGPLAGPERPSHPPRAPVDTAAAALAMAGHARIAVVSEESSPAPAVPPPPAREDLHGEQARRLAFARRLTDFKRSAAVANKEIAQQVGCGMLTISRWLHGERLPAASQLTALARAVRDDPGQLALAAGYTLQDLEAAERARAALTRGSSLTGLRATDPLADLALPPAAYQRLNEQGIVSIADLTDRTQAELDAIPGLERYWVPMITQRLAVHGFTLRAEEAEPPPEPEPVVPPAPEAGLAATVPQQVETLLGTKAAPAGGPYPMGPVAGPVDREPGIHGEPGAGEPAPEETLAVGDRVPMIELGPSEEIDMSLLEELTTPTGEPAPVSLPIRETVPVDYPEHPLFQQAGRVTQLVLIALGSFPKEHPLTPLLWQTVVDMPRQLALAIRAPDGPAMARALALAAEHALSSEYYLRLADDLRLLPPGLVAMGLEQLAGIARSIEALQEAV